MAPPNLVPYTVCIGSAVMNRKRPEYPTLLELIRGRVRCTAMAGSSAAILAVGCGYTTTGTDSSFPDFGAPDIHDVPATDAVNDFDIKNPPDQFKTIGCQSDANCGDGNPCTDDSCNLETGACHHSDIDCDDGDPKTYDFCIPWGEDTPHCINDGLCKDDGDPCTSPAPNSCAPWVKDCDDGEPCTSDICDPIKGDCVNTPDGC